MTEFATIESQDVQNIGITTNTVSEPSAEIIDAWTLRYTTGKFIKELAEKAKKFQALSTRTDEYLYRLLQDCYDDFQILNEPSSNLASNANQILTNYCKTVGVKLGKDTQVLSRLLKCVFIGADRSKISTYSYVIKFGVKNKVAKGKLFEAIKLAGGIQKIKEASFSEISVKAKTKMEKNLQAALTNVLRTNLGTVDIPMAKSAISKLKSGASVVLVATIDDKRKFVIRAATSEDSVINAAVLAITNSKITIESPPETAAV
jgi:hypothetical protein